jgi:sugar/nucleoside kinase (ribokinase family)
MSDALAALDDPYDVAVSVNRSELHGLARLLDCKQGDDADAVAAVRDALGVTGVVLHARDAAIAGTREQRVRVPNPSVETPAHRTGASDRFDAGLAHGLAAGSGWRAALALGNLCGAHYVESGETGDRRALADAARRLEADGSL